MSEQAANDPYDEVIGVIAAMNPSKQFGRNTIAVYSEALSDVPIEELREAVWEIVKTRTYPPTVSEVLALVVARRLDLPEPMAAWEMLCRVLEERSGYRELPATIQRAADAVGGPFTIRQTDNEIALRAQFLTAYKEFAATAQNEAVLAIGQSQRKEIESGTEANQG